MVWFHSYEKYKSKLNEQTNQIKHIGTENRIVNTRVSGVWGKDEMVTPGWWRMETNPSVVSKPEHAQKSKYNAVHSKHRML